MIRPPGDPTEHRHWFDGTRRKVAGVLFVAALVASIPSLLVAKAMIDDTKAEIESGRLQLAQLAATQADRLLTEAFYEIELMATAIPLDSDEQTVASDAPSLRTVHGRSSSFSAGVMALDTSGEAIIAEPASQVVGADEEAILTAAVRADDRTVSQPFIATGTGQVATALSVPVYDRTGARVATMIGYFDLTEPLVSDLIGPATQLGPSGHADLVDERGLVLASTDPGHVLTTGDHPEFYQRMAEARTPSVERVPHNPGPDSLDQSRWHIMAYAPLRNAPWGVAMGASEQETMALVRRLRVRLITLGMAAAATLIVGAALATFLTSKRDPAAIRMTHGAEPNN